MTNLLLVVVVVLLVWSAVSFVRRHRRGIVAERGISVGADLGTLTDLPRVRVRAVIKAGPDRVLLVLTPEAGHGDSGVTKASDLDLLVLLSEEDFGFDLLHEWERSQAALAIVMPPDSRIVRLRSIEDLQPLTLRRIDED